MKNIINVNALVSGSSTNSEAVALFVEMDKNIIEGNIVKVSLKEVTPISSSFFNSSFMAIIDKHGIGLFKKHIKIINCSKANLTLLKRYFQDFHKQH